MVMDGVQFLGVQFLRVGRALPGFIRSNSELLAVLSPVFTALLVVNMRPHTPEYQMVLPQGFTSKHSSWLTGPRTQSDVNRAGRPEYRYVNG